MSSDLDNPFWSALCSRHAGIAHRVGDAARYPAEFAPFLGVAHDGADVGDALDALIAAGDSVYLLGVAPRVPEGWRLQAFGDLAQMIRTEPLAVEHGPDIVPLCSP